MLDKLKRALVESYIGAIALGYVLAQAILYFMLTIVSPFTAWLSHAYFKDVPSRPTPADLPFYNALVDLASFVSLTLLWFVLMYWLYVKPGRSAKSEPVSGSE
ncbi:MAG TPA: hypothetical protein VGT03_14735 [Candidatus Acidoferrales bacterium]|nr:hypothetical protein [Candidatus Acidoferrales bacterium]